MPKHSKTVDSSAVARVMALQLAARHPGTIWTVASSREQAERAYAAARRRLSR